MASVGSPWWLDRLNRRKANLRIAKIGTIGGILAIIGIKSSCDAEDDDIELKTDALELQKSQGWDVGSPQKPLVYNDMVVSDSLDSPAWTQYLDPRMLLSAYEPKQESWRPFVVPTLVQSLNQNTLRTKMMPINSPAMRTAYARGLGMREIIRGNPLFNKAMLITDLPGPESVAFTAALADLIDPVITFDNWPHPLAIVPSHALLSSMLFYAKEVAQKSQLRSFAAPPMLVLDRSRLTSYVDEDSQFDNRYVAKMPTADNLEKLGIKQALYIVPSDEHASRESDDLNADFTHYKERGIKLSTLPQTHFVPEGSESRADTVTQRPPSQSHRAYYYGGRSWGHRWFYSNYPGYGSFDPAMRVREQFPFQRTQYDPVQRPTMFQRSFAQGTGSTKVKPTNFGQATSRISRSTGSFTGVRSGRSGSFGRSRSFFSS